MHRTLDIQLRYYKWFFGVGFKSIFSPSEVVNGHVTVNVSVRIKDHELLLIFKFGC